MLYPDIKHQESLICFKNYFIKQNIVKFIFCSYPILNYLKKIFQNGIKKPELHF